MAWEPPELQNLKLQYPFTIGNLITSGPQVGQLQDSQIGGFTGSTQLTAGQQLALPPLGNPHIANHVYIDPVSLLWLVSTG